MSDFWSLIDWLILWELRIGLVIQLSILPFVLLAAFFMFCLSKADWR